jgi:hypothetical protein
MKTNELGGAALDWAVAKAWQHVYSDGALIEAVKTGFNPSSNWAHGGEIIEREKIALLGVDSDEWEAWVYFDRGEVLCRTFGTTPLIAAMRCYVASKLGDDVNLPEGLQ